MEHMNETSQAPGTPGANQQHRPPHQDLDRLRRSSTDRYLAGVAGGLGRHFGVDPTIIRVLLAVLAFFGGAGVLIYGACWLFVPEDGKAEAPIHVGSEPRRLILFSAVGIGFLLAMGDAFSGFNAGWPIASVAVIIAIVMIARERKDGKSRQGAAPAAPTDPTASYAQYGEQYAQYGQQVAAQYTDYAQQVSTQAMASAGLTDPGATTVVPPVPPAPPAPPTWQPPQPPLVPPRPRRTGVIWFWPTLALIAIALGTLGIIDSGSTNIEPGVYPATAVAITGVMLLIGSFFGRPGGLILIGFVSTFMLSVATVLGTFQFDGREIEVAPTTAAAVQSSYTVNMGRIELDLTKVTDPENLAGRDIDISLNAGEIVVIVPRGLNVTIDAEHDFAGGIQVPGYDGGGIQDSVNRTLVGTPANTNQPLGLELDASVGQITVEQR